MEIGQTFSLVVGLDQKVQFLSPSLAQQWGGSPEEAVGKPCKFCLVGGTHPSPGCPALKMQEIKREFSFLTDLKIPNGTFKIRCTPCQGDRGTWAVMVRMEPEGLFFSSEFPPLSSKSPFWFFLENLKIGFWAIDREVRTIQVNHHLAKMFGYRTEEMVGRYLFEFMDEVWKEKCRYLFERRKLGIQESHEFTFQRADGQPLHAFLVTSPLYNVQGQFDGARAFVKDIGERKKTETEEKKNISEIKAVRERAWFWEEGLRRGVCESLEEKILMALKKANGHLNALNGFPINPAMSVSNIREATTLLQEAIAWGEDLLQRLREGRSGPLLFPDEDDLNPKEIEVLKGMADGLGSKEIAQNLGKSLKTIEYRRKKLMEKTGAKNLLELIKYAIRKGYIRLD